MNPMDISSQASDQVLGEIGTYMEDIMAENMGKDIMENKANPKNLPGEDPAEPGVTTSEDKSVSVACEDDYGMEDGDMAIIEAEYGAETPGVV